MKGKHLKLHRFGDDRVGIELEGNRDKPEPALTSIVFPGGEVTVARVDDDTYWVHVNCFRPPDGSDDVVGRRHGRFVDSRIDCQGKHANEVIGGDFARPDAYHVAVKINVAT